jgi:ABC-2 type transport system permease protein
MGTIFLRTIKDKKIAIIVYCIIGIAVMWMYIALFPYIQGESKEFEKLFDGYPEGFLTAFGITDFEMDTLEKFLKLEQFGLMLGIMAIFLSLSVAGSAISGEIDKGTIELLLSKPISRVRIFFARYFAGVAILAIFLSASIFSVFPLSKLHNVDLVSTAYLYLAIISITFALTVFSMAMMFSAIFSERSRTSMTTGAILGVMYLINIAALLVDRVQALKYFSLFHYFDFGSALVGEYIDSVSFGIFMGLSFLFFIAGAVWFNKRDVAI